MFNDKSTLKASCKSLSSTLIGIKICQVEPFLRKNKTPKTCDSNGLAQLLHKYIKQQDLPMQFTGKPQKTAQKLETTRGKSSNGHFASKSTTTKETPAALETLSTL